MAGPIAASRPGPVEQAAHVGVQLGEAEGDAAAGEVGAHLLEHRRGGEVDLGDGAGVEDQPAGAGRHRVGDGAEPGVDVVGVEEQEVALDEGDGQARDRAGVGAAVQLVEAVAAGNAAEQRVARVHHLVKQVGEGRADRDEHAVQHPEADRREERDHREDELHPADPPDRAQRGDVDQAEGRGDQDGAERRDRQDGERRLEVEDDEEQRRGGDDARRAASGRRRWR